LQKKNGKDIKGTFFKNSMREVLSPNLE
jgi:hypothetical protein